MHRYFSEKIITPLLVKYRLQLAARRKRLCYLSKKNPAIFYNILGHNSFVKLEKLLPPRRKWKRLSKKKRKSLTKFQADSLAIQASVSDCRDTNADWHKNLDCFIVQLKNTALYDREYKISTPRSYYLKGENGKGRIFSSYEIKDKIILEILTIYLKDIYTSFVKEVYYSTIRTSHKTILNDIAEFTHSAVTSSLYIAQIDIKRFYDLLDHEVVKTFFNKFIDRAAINKNPIHPRAIELFFSFLSTYNTYKALAQLQVTPKEVNEIPELNLTSLKENLEIVGIPTGPSLSSLISNLLFEELDYAMINEVGYKEAFLYERFVDNIIVMSKTQAQCESIFNKVKTTLTRLKCIIHEIPTRIVYDDSYLNMRSTPVHCWKRDFKNEENSTPIFTFLGCQVPFPKTNVVEAMQISSDLF